MVYVKDLKTVLRFTKLTDTNSTLDWNGIRKWRYITEIENKATNIYVTHYADTQKDWCKQNYGNQNNTENSDIINIPYGKYCKLNCKPGWSGTDVEHLKV